MKLLPVFLLAVATAAQAQSDAPPISTHATLYHCPNGPGVAVVAEMPDGTEQYAGCWGSDPVPQDEYRNNDSRQSHTMRK